MSVNTLSVIFVFIVADAIRSTVVRSAFLNGAELWSFLLSTCLVSILAMSLVVGIRRRRELGELFTKRRKELLIVLLVNTWHFGFAGTLHILAAKYVPAPIIGMLIQSVILFSALWERMFFKEKQTKAFWLLLAGNLIGLYLIATAGTEASFNYYYLIPVAAAFCFSITDNFSRYYLNKNIVQPEIMAFFRPIGFILFIPVLFLTNSVIDLRLDFSNLFNPEIMPQIILTGISVSVVWIYLNKSYRLASVTNICMLAMLKPILILILSAIFLGEYFNPVQSVGALILIISSFTFILLKRRR